MTHQWAESSGTTDTCRVCGCTKYYENKYGCPSREASVKVFYSRWIRTTLKPQGEWIGYTTTDAVKPPVCRPGRGPAPGWLFL